MKYAISLSFFATPALAHPGPHLHAQDTTPLVLGLSLVAVAAAVIADKIHK